MMTEINHNYEYLYKILMIGNTNVGKSSLLLQLTDNRFMFGITPTIGVDFGITNIVIDNTNIKLQIWDTAGQDRFRNITTSYYKGCNGVFLVFDVTNRKSFDDLNYWYSELLKHNTSKFVLFVIGNKTDLVERRNVSSIEANDYAKSINAVYMESNAVNHRITENIFYKIAKQINDVSNYNLNNNFEIDKYSYRKKKCCSIQ